MAENGDVTNFTRSLTRNKSPTAKTEGTWVIFSLSSLVLYFQLEGAQEHQPGTPDSAGKSLFAVCFGSALLGNFARRLQRRDRALFSHRDSSPAAVYRCVKLCMAAHQCTSVAVPTAPASVVVPVDVGLLDWAQMAPHGPCHLPWVGSCACACAKPCVHLLTYSQHGRSTAH